MKQIKQQWRRWAARIDAMSLRERTLIFLAAALVLVMLVHTLLLSPLLARQKKLSQQVVETQAKVNTMQLQIQALVQARNADPDAPLRMRLQQLREQSASTSQALQAIQSGLVSPGQMPALLEDILRRNRPLRLVALKTLPVQRLTGTEEAAAGTTDKKPDTNKPPVPSPSVYRHGVEITVEGGYPELVRYLAQIESLPWRMFWGKADLNAEKHPRVTLTLKLYTLSLDQTWLAL